MSQRNLALTQLARAAGCAAKISQADLQIALPVPLCPRVLSVMGDDGLSFSSMTLRFVETVDIFPPIVDDHDYGRVAANALRTSTPWARGQSAH